MKSKRLLIFPVLALLILSSIIAPLSLDGSVKAHTTGFRTTTTLEENGFESYAPLATDIGDNWSYTPDIGGPWAYSDAAIFVDVNMFHAGAQSLNVTVSPLSATGYGMFTHNLTKVQNKGIVNYTFWFYANSPVTTFIATFFSNKTTAFPGGTIMDPDIAITDSYGTPSVYLVYSGTYYWAGYYNEHGWNALFIQLNTINNTMGIATNQTTMPTIATNWSILGSSLGVIDMIGWYLLDSSTMLSLDDFKVDTSAPLITSEPITYSRISSSYSYNAVCTQSEETNYWNITTNATWLHWPISNPNGTAYCNLTGTAPATMSYYWVNLTVNDTDSYDYQFFYIGVCEEIWGVNNVHKFGWNFPYDTALETSDGIYLAFNGETTGLDNSIVRYNASTRLWESPQIIRNGLGDDHEQPMIYELHNHSIGCFIALGTAGIEYYISNPHSITGWTLITTIEPGRYCAYPRLIETFNGTWYLFYRSRTGGSFQSWNCSISTNEGLTWGKSFPITDGETIITSQTYIMDMVYDNISCPGSPMVLMTYLTANTTGRTNLGFVEYDLTTFHVFSDSGVDYGHTFNVTEVNAVCGLYNATGELLDYPRIKFIESHHWVFFERHQAGQWWEMSYFPHTGAAFLGIRDMGHFSTGYSQQYDLNETIGGNITLFVSNSTVANRFGGSIDQWNYTNATLNWTKVHIVLNQVYALDTDCYFGSPVLVRGSYRPRLAITEWCYTDPSQSIRAFVWDTHTGFIRNGTNITPPPPPPIPPILTWASTPILFVYVGDIYIYTPATNLTAIINMTTSAPFLSYIDGNITGVPMDTQMGVYWVHVRATNGMQTIYQNYTISVTESNLDWIIWISIVFGIFITLLGIFTEYRWLLLIAGLFWLAISLTIFISLSIVIGLIMMVVGLVIFILSAIEITEAKNDKHNS